jgi:hypothetical protein
VPFSGWSSVIATLLLLLSIDDVEGGRTPVVVDEVLSGGIAAQAVVLLDLRAGNAGAIHLNDLGPNITAA